MISGASGVIQDNSDDATEGDGSTIMKGLSILLNDFSLWLSVEPTPAVEYNDEQPRHNTGSTTLLMSRLAGADLAFLSKSRPNARSHSTVAGLSAWGLDRS
jgi:hypothetical protein